MMWSCAKQKTAWLLMLFALGCRVAVMMFRQGQDVSIKSLYFSPADIVTVLQPVLEQGTLNTCYKQAELLTLLVYCFAHSVPTNPQQGDEGSRWQRADPHQERGGTAGSLSSQ
jgi:hypothetical protein